MIRKNNEKIEALLKFAFQNGMIDLSYVQDMIEMDERKKILDAHPYKIWVGSNGKYYTYLPVSGGGRKLVKKTTREAVENAIIDNWNDNVYSPTFKELFDEWQNERLSRGEILRQTYDRINMTYKRYFLEFGKKKIGDIKETDIESFVMDNLYSKNFTTKEFGNFKSVVLSVFKYAKRRRLVEFSISYVMSDIEIPKKAFNVNKKPDDKMSFSEEDFSKIMGYLESHIDLLNIGLIIMFESGLRIGELTALKCDDIDGNHIHVSKTEVRLSREGGGFDILVQEFPKTKAGNRIVIFPREYVCYLDMAKEMSSGEYLFESDGKRLHVFSFRNRLMSVCKSIGIEYKSPHKIRMTYATRLIDGGASDSIVTSQMGHVDIHTTFAHYYKDRKTDDQKAEVIDKVLGNQK